MKKFDNNVIEINGTLYDLVDGGVYNCCGCDVVSYCNTYNLRELCRNENKIFKKHTLCIEGVKYVAKINNSPKKRDCEVCDIPKSTCLAYNLLTKCMSTPGSPHVYFERIGVLKKTLRNGKKDKKLEEKPKRKRKFNPKNCQRSIKDQFTIGDITFTLTCHHSFEWTIAKTENGKITIEVYPNRNVAKKEFERKKELSK